VFDLDGTLTDNMAWHVLAFARFLRRHGLPELTMAMRERIDGKRNAEIFPILFDREMAAGEVEAFEEEKEAAYRELSRDRLTPTAGAVELIELLTEHAIGVAVATSAPAKNVAHTLAAIGLADRISTIARSDAVPRGKPFPDVFLHAARELGVPAEECLAFEDAPAGIASAVNAGMRCVGITTTFSASTLAAGDPPPDAAYPHFSAFLEGHGRWLLKDRTVRRPA
jgi:HAD superfamily hydrolase (TIGR01509 family)